MKLTEILDRLKLASPIPINEEIVRNLAKIKKICDRKYSNQSFYGNAALNRQMLLDKEIADFLTPEVIHYLFTHEPTEDEKIYRNSTGQINLRDAIYHGFADGLFVVQLMPNNEPTYTPEAYKEQKEKYKVNTLRIVESIKRAANIKEIDDNAEETSLMEQFEEAVSMVNAIKTLGQSDKLLSVPGYTPQNMRDQVNWGFAHLCDHLHIILDTKNKIKNETLDSLCEKFLQNPNAMLDGKVIHLFYDRAHIEAALEQDTVITIGNKKYTYQDIFRKMVEKISADSVAYPDCAKEQFYLRFGLVKTDLNHRFSKSSLESGVLDKQLRMATSRKDWEEVRHIVSADKKPTPEVVQQARNQAAKDRRWDIVSAIEKARHREARELTQGPLPKSFYTYQLEVLTRKLMKNQKFHMEKSKGAVLISFADGSKYNIAKIVKHANFEHFTLSSQDFELYDNYHDKFSHVHSTLDPNDIKRVSAQFAGISAAEMKALNIYTGKYYRQMNSFMRGNTDYGWFGKSLLRDVIIHSVMCGSALSKFPEEYTPGISYRIEQVFNQKAHLKRIEAASQRGVVQLEGFISTSTEPDPCFRGNVRFKFTELRGKYIAPLSQHKHEHEYLIPPTHLQFTDYTYDPALDMNYFQASPVIDLNTVDMEDLLTINQAVVQELEEYLTDEIKRLSKTRSSLLDSEKTKLKLNGFKECQRKVKILMGEVTTGKLSQTEIVSRFDEISKETELVAQIQRGTIKFFKNSNTTSQVFFKAVKEDAKLLDQNKLDELTKE